MQTRGALQFGAWLVIFFAFALFTQPAATQAVIQLKDYPTAVGTFFITEDDIENQVTIDVGEPGINKVWNLNQTFASVLRRQIIVEKSMGFYADQFAESNVVTRYVGNIGELIHTWYFDEVPGEMYIYQKISDEKVSIQGLGIRSPVYKGAVKNHPDIFLHHFPLKYGDRWESASEFSIAVDTLMFGSPTTVRADISDSIYSEVDGIGTLVLPLAHVKCLRLKSYITSKERLFLDGRLLRSKGYRTINYTWVAKNFGTIARVYSHCNEPNDRFTQAKQISRLHLFNPKIHLTMLPLTCAPGEFLKIPVEVNELTDLGVVSLQMKISYQPNLLSLTAVETAGTLCEAWGAPEQTPGNDHVLITLKGTTPLTGKGPVCYLRFVVNPAIVKQTITDVLITTATVKEIGPEILTHPGKILIKPNIHDPDPLSQNPGMEPAVPTEFRLGANYPNPFNPATTIEFDLPQAATVTLSIFDARGRLVTNMHNGDIQPGRHSVTWLGRDDFGELVSSGLYFYRLEAKPDAENASLFLETRKMLFIK